jgi:tetratricopeptide (TPR) repeat protein
VHILIVGGTRQERRRRADAVAASGSSVVRLDDVERAFPNAQVGGTRFVLTQSTYVMQALVDSLAPDGRVIATGDRAALERNAPEAFERRGPWHLFQIEEISSHHISDAEDVTEDTDRDVHSCTAFAVPSTIPTVSSVAMILARAFDSTSAVKRLALCREAVTVDSTSALAWLALASAARESEDMSAARGALDRASALAPGWAAVHYENGKFWLGYDDMAQARDSFRRAADLMPSFSAAWSNLGATLGEMDEPEAALAAFAQALAHDPRGFQIVNNIGVTTRELGRLAESEAAFRRVLELAPAFVFGYYNLGHTLFLAGKYSEALLAYEEGQRRDPHKNPRQGCRLAMMRLATGDVEGAGRDLWRFVDAAPGAEREDLLLEAHEIAAALLTAHPSLEAARPLLNRIAATLVPTESSSTAQERFTTEDTSHQTPARRCKLFDDE